MLARVDSGWVGRWVAAPVRFTLKLGSGVSLLDTSTAVIPSHRITILRYGVNKPKIGAPHHPGSWKVSGKLDRPVRKPHKWNRSKQETPQDALMPPDTWEMLLPPSPVLRCNPRIGVAMVQSSRVKGSDSQRRRLPLSSRAFRVAGLVHSSVDPLPPFLHGDSGRHVPRPRITHLRRTYAPPGARVRNAGTDPARPPVPPSRRARS